MRTNQEFGADLIQKTWKYYLSRGLIREAQEKVIFFMQYGESAPQKLAGLQIAYGTLSHNLGLFVQSRDAYSSALKYFVKAQSVEQRIIVLNHLSWAEFRLGNYEKAESFAKYAVDDACKLDDQRHVCKSLNNTAWIEHFRGHTIDAFQIHSQILDIYTALDDEQGIAFSLTNKGWTSIEIGQFDQAFSDLERAIRIFNILKNRQLYAFANLILAIGNQELASFQSARNKIDQICLPIFTEIGDTWGLALALQKLAEICLVAGGLQDVNEFITKALEITTRNHDRWGIVNCHIIKSQYHLALDDPFEARRHVEIAVRNATDMNYHGLMTKLHGIKARIYWLNNRPHEAAAEIGHAFDKLQIPYQKQRFEAKFQDIIMELNKLNIPTHMTI